MKISKYFDLEELVASETAARNGIDNYPPPGPYENLKMLTAAADQIREMLGFPIHVNSAYRCPQLNSLVGSRPTSAHVDGLAMDFTCSGFGPPEEVCRAILASTIPFDQLIFEFSSWTHFAIAHKGLVGRREVLTIDKKGTRKGLE